MQAGKGVFFGWYVVLACFVTLFLSTGAGYFTFSVFMIPLEDSFQASRTAITAVGSITALVAGFATPLVGILIHSWGPRGVIASGAALTGGAFLLMSMATSLWHLYLFGVLLGAGLAATTIIPNQTLVSHWFVRRRGIAMGIMGIPLTLGAAVGQMGSAQIFDATDSYVGVFAGLMLVNGICAVLAGRARPPSSSHQSAGSRQLPRMKSRMIGIAWSGQSR